MSGPSILVAEDDVDLRDLLVTLLGGHGFAVTARADGAAALTAAAERPPDLVVLDVHLPGLNGHEVCRRLREFSGAPVLFLTASADPTTELAGFAAGGDDFVTKPFDQQVLVARVRALLARSAPAPGGGPVVTAGEVRVDLAARSVTVAGTEVDLSRLEYDLLAVLAERVGRIVDRPVLLAEVWDEWHDDDHVVDAAVSRLRARLAAHGVGPERISTHRGLGYRLNP